MHILPWIFRYVPVLVWGSSAVLQGMSACAGSVAEGKVAQLP